MHRASRPLVEGRACMENYLNKGTTFSPMRLREAMALSRGITPLCESIRFVTPRSQSIPICSATRLGEPARSSLAPGSGAAP